MIDSSVSHNLPGLIDDIISKDKNITNRELCDAIHQHLRDSRKPSGGDCAYPSYLHAINDCLRKRREWAYLVDQASKMNSNNRRKGENNSLLADVLEVENARNGPEGDSEGSADLHQEDLPVATLSDSSNDKNDTPMVDVNREDDSVALETGGNVEAKSADSSS